MNLELSIAVFVILALLGAWWQFSIIAKRTGKNLKSISSNSVLRGEKGKKQQVGLILLLVVMLVWFQWAGWLF
jgi:uncharacterized membrane protein